MADVKSVTCIGVVFQFNSSGVLFEFSNESGQDFIGFVKSTDIKINQNSFIPEHASNSEKISKYLQVGDEIRCTVVESTDLPPYEYVEDDDEVDQSGNVKTISKKVVVNPEWVASTAELVVPVNVTNDDNDTKEAGNDEKVTEDDSFVLNLNETEQFDYDEEFEDQESKNVVSNGQDEENDKEIDDEASPEVEDGPDDDRVMDLDDVILFEDVDLLDFEEGKDKVADKAKKDEKSVPKKKESGTIETFTEKGRLIQLKKPSRSEAKTTQAYFEVTTGPYANRQVLVDNARITIFGYSLINSTLTYYVSHGDECTIEYRVVDAKQSEAKGQNTTLVICKVYFGSKNIPPNDDEGFRQWLLDKNTDHQKFMNWIRNLCPARPYFAFPGDTYLGQVSGFVRESEDSTKACGLFLKVTEMVADAELEKIPGEDGAEATGETKFAILQREDFYVCGVAALYSDLRLLIRNGETVMCQVQPISSSEKLSLYRELGQTPENCVVTHIAYFGYVGPKRPQTSSMSPSDAPHLEKFLQERDLTVRDFETMRAKPQPKMGPMHVMPNLPMSGMVPQPPFMGPRPPIGAFPPFCPPHPGQFPGVFGIFFPQIPVGQITVATTVAAKAINFAFPPNDAQLISILENPVEVEAAVQLVKNLSQSLILQMRRNIHNKISSTTEELQSQLLQVRTAEQVLLRADEQHPKTNQLLQDQLKAVQNQMMKEAEAAKAAIVDGSKSKPVLRDARKILDSFKASKAKEEGKKEPNPLMTLREYIIGKKTITKDEGTIWFDTIGFPKSVKTNFKAALSNFYYNLNSVVHCVQYRPNIDQYFEYVQSARKLQIVPVFKADIGPLIDYLTDFGAKKPSNLIDISYKELNPQLFPDGGPNEKVEDWKDRYINQKRTANDTATADSGSKLGKMGDQELIAQAQLQMSLMSGDPPKEKKRSRFDLMVNPSNFSAPPPTSGFDPIPVMMPGGQMTVPPPFAINLNQPPPQATVGLQQRPAMSYALQSQPQGSPFSLDINPFAPPIVQQPQPDTDLSKEPQLASGWRENDRARREEFYSRSPTLERMQEKRQLSPQRSRSPIRSNWGQATEIVDPFRVSRSPPRSSVGADRYDKSVGMDRQRDEELQLKLFEEFKQEREARRRREEAEELLRREELSRNTIQNDDIESVRRREEELRIREREAEIERLRQLKREAEERKLKEAEDSERMWKLHLEKKAKEEEERQLRRRMEFHMSAGVPPPPSNAQMADLNTNNGLIGKTLPVSIPERRAPPPPPILSIRGQQAQEVAKASWESSSSIGQARPDDWQQQLSWEDRSDRKSGSRERDWASLRDAYTTVSQGNVASDTTRPSNDPSLWDSRSSSSGQSSYVRRY